MTTENKTRTQSELTVRSYRAAPSSANREERTIESVMATEEPVLVYDYRRWEMIREILLTDGVELPDQIPLLDNHNRYDCDDVFGSTRNIRVEEGKLIGRNYFADDEKSLRAFNKVADGHIRDNSIGYTIEAFQDLEPGEYRTIGNREFTAGSEPLRIATKWKLRENSITPIGADDKAKMRSWANSKKEVVMEKDEKPEKAEEKKTVNTETEEERSLRVIEARKKSIMAICPTGLEHVAQRSILAGHSLEEARAAMLEAHAEMAPPVGTPQVTEEDEKARKETEEPKSEFKDLDDDIVARALCNL